MAHRQPHNPDTHYFAYWTDGNTDATKTDGTTVTAARGSGCTLANSTTYFFVASQADGFSGELSGLDCQLKWASAVVATFTIETCVFPQSTQGIGTGPVDVSDYDTTKGNWLQQNPTGSYITVTSSDGTTGGATVTASTIAVAGGTAGGADINLWAFAGRRVRIKAVVTTGGVVRCGFHGKAA